MKDTVQEYTFTNTMINHGFSYEGSKALFEYLTQYEEDCDHELEFDPILRYGYQKRTELEPDLIATWEKIQMADHIVFVYPNW